MSHSESFKRAIAFTLRWEGGYVNDPDDPGGETNFGISRRAHPDVNIRALTREQAEQIYHDEYWKPIRGDELPPRVALVVLDWSVHSNRRLVVRHLQRELNFIGRQVDGRLGPITAARAREMGHTHRLDRDLANRVTIERFKFLMRLITRRSKMRKYLWGWMRRVNGLFTAVEQ